MNIQEAIKHVTAGENLPRDAMHAVMKTIMQGEATPAQIGGLLIALRIKGETVDEITAAAQVMRELSSHVEIDKTHLVDTCGTGGDGANTYNISTTSAFIVAAAGGRVAKHGNRSVSSTCGSADVLEAAGVNLELSPEQVAQCVNEIGIGFMFAPMHHSAMKHAIGPRKELGMRTIFNVLGPLTNPASAPNQVLGVFADELLTTMTEVLQQLGSEHVLVVRSNDGMDEISIAANTKVSELKDGKISQYEISPADFSLPIESIESLAVHNVDDSLAMMKSVLNNTDGAARNIAALNAGAAIYAAGLSNDINGGVGKALEVIKSGAAMEKLNAYVNATNNL